MDEQYKKPETAKKKVPVIAIVAAAAVVLAVLIMLALPKTEKTQATLNNVPLVAEYTTRRGETLSVAYFDEAGNPAASAETADDVTTAVFPAQDGGSTEYRIAGDTVEAVSLFDKSGRLDTLTEFRTKGSGSYAYSQAEVELAGPGIDSRAFQTEFWKRETFFSSSGTKTADIEYDVDGNIIGMTEYDSEGRITSKTVNSGDGSSVIYQVGEDNSDMESHFDPQGNKLTELFYYYPDDSEGMIVTTAENGEDIAGDNVKKEMYDADGALVYSEEPYYENGVRWGKRYWTDSVNLSFGTQKKYLGVWRTSILEPDLKDVQFLSCTINYCYFQGDERELGGFRVLYWPKGKGYVEAGNMTIEHLREWSSFEFNFDTPTAVDGFLVFSDNPRETSYTVGVYLSDVSYVIMD